MNTLEVISNERLTAEDKIISVKNREYEEQGKHKKYVLALNIICPILAVLIGILVLNVTGLYDGMNSTAGKLTLSIVISCSYLMTFRRALFSK